MSGSSIIIERHGWRGFKSAGGELGMARTVGFFTFTYCPFLLSEWLGTRLGALRDALKPKHVVREEKK